MKKILIIDDSIVARKMIQKSINGIHSDWEVAEACSGDEAILLCDQERKFDLITLDFNMPGKLGLEVATIIKTSQPQAKIVMITANTQSSVRSRAHDLNVDLMEKPMNAEKIKILVEILENKL